KDRVGRVAARGGGSGSVNPSFGFGERMAGDTPRRYSMARPDPGARLVRVAAAAAALIAGASAAFGQLMVPDLTGRRIMLFSAVDGSLIDANWITEANAVGWTFPSNPG